MDSATHSCGTVRSNGNSLGWVVQHHSAQCSKSSCLRGNELATVDAQAFTAANASSSVTQRVPWPQCIHACSTCHDSQGCPDSLAVPATMHGVGKQRSPCCTCANVADTDSSTCSRHGLSARVTADCHVATRAHTSASAAAGATPPDWSSPPPWLGTSPLAWAASS